METANYDVMTFKQFCFANWKALQTSGALNLEIFPIAEFFGSFFKIRVSLVQLYLQMLIAMARFWSIFAFTVTELLEFFCFVLPRTNLLQTPFNIIINLNQPQKILQQYQT